eukprot:4996627-Prorocentrum_lima.AAC.1
MEQELDRLEHVSSCEIPDPSVLFCGRVSKFEELGSDFVETTPWDVVAGKRWLHKTKPIHILE